MYDLKSVKLSESQAMLHRTERNAAQLDKKVEKLKSEKKSLEEQLENAKVEISQDTKSLEIERSERDKREKEAIEAVKKFEIKQREVHDCIELKDEVHQKYLTAEDAAKTCESELKSAQTEIESCQSQNNQNSKTSEQMKNDLEQLQHQTEDKDTKYKEEISLWKNKIEESQQKSEAMKEELHQIKAQHDELVSALKDLGVKGLKRDLAWVELSEDVRSTILRGILDSEIIPNELLGTPATLEENEDKEEDGNDDDKDDRQLVVEDSKNSDDEPAVEQQQELPPNVAKEPEKVDDQIDIPIAPKDSNDSKEDQTDDEEIEENNDEMK